MSKAHDNKVFKIRHLENLQKLFNLNQEETHKLFKSLRLIECKLNRLFTVACERNLTEPEEKEIKRLRERVKKLTNNVKGLYFNQDPRGYSIKLETEEAKELRELKNINLYSDWGCYAILAPDFN